MIKPEFFDDPDVGDLSLAARLLFLGLLTQADRRGRLKDDPKRLRARLLPYDAVVDAEALLQTLTAAGFLVRYVVEGRAYLQIRSFEKHQRPHPREAESEIPGPPADALIRPSREKVRPRRVKDMPSNADPKSGVLILDSGVRNLEHGADRAKPARPPAAAGRVAPAFDAFWALYPRKTAKTAALKAWTALNPTAALQRTITEALAWQVARDDWLRDGGKYIPHPATWLHRGQWQDEPPPAASLLSDVGRQNLANGRLAVARILGRES